MSRRKLRRALCCAGISTIGLYSSAMAQVSTWTHIGDGTFNVSSNWAGGVPGVSSTALFNLNSTYDVTFSANATNTQLTLTAGTINFLSGGTPRSYLINGSMTMGTATLAINGITLSGPASSGVESMFLRTGANLSVINGGSVVTQGLTMSDIGTNTVLTVSGAGSGFADNGAAGDSFIGVSVNAAPLITFANNGTGDFSGTTLRLADSVGIGETATFQALSGSTVTLGSVRLAQADVMSQAANFVVTSATATQSGASTLGIGGTSDSAATLTVNSGGQFTSGTGTLVVNNVGTIHLAGGTLNLNNGTVQLFGTLNRTGGTLNLAAGQRFTVQSAGQMTLNTSLTTPASGTFTINGPSGDVDLGSNPFNVNSAGVGSITGGGTLNCGSINVGVAGGGNSTLTITGSTISAIGGFGSSIGANGSDGQLSMFTNSNVTLPASLTVGIGTNSSGTVNVSNSTLTIGNLFLGSAADTGETGEMDLTGGSSLVSLTGNSSTIGQFSNSVATLSVANGTFDAGSGLVQVLPTGLISIGFGTLSTSGTLNLVGGKMTVGSSGRFAMSPGSRLTLTSGGAATFSSGFTDNGTVTLASGTLRIAAGLTVPLGGEIDVSPAGTIDATSSGITLSGGVINLNGGTIITNALFTTLDGSSFHFNAGTVIFPGLTLDFPESSLLLGSGATLVPGQNLVVTNQLALSYPLTLNGGILSVGSLSGGTLLTVKTGTLNFNSALNFQAGGPLGTIIDIGTGLTISASSIFVGGPTRVVVSGGTLSSSGSISVGTFGELQLNGLTALVTSPTAINNSGIVHGNGMILGGSINNLPGGVFREETGERTIVNLLDNTGTINLLGGELDSLQFITNEATGHISGRGTLVTDTGLGNLGTIALSAGLSDFEGSISNVGTIIVSGGGTATFYDNVSNSGAAQFRVSTNSTVVFLGNVTGLAAFTGNGIKDFEGSASSGPILTTGSSIVGGSSSLSADSIRENALTVIGVARINPNGGAVGASHLNSLTIDGAANAWDGKLDLADNALVLDYSGASPLGTVLNQIITGFHNGDWHGNGITSSTAAEVASDLSNPHKTAVGYAEASALGISGTFVGQPFDNTSLLIRYTFAGDANLDGKVNALDFNALASNFGGASGKFWNQGDFNYDGVTNTLDFTVLGSNFNQALPSLALGTLVPEPAGVLIILAAFQFLLPRHRKVW